MSGSDCGNIFMWDKNTEAIAQWLKGDESGVVNCLESHPNFPVMATSGLDHNVKVWSPMNPNGVRIILTILHERIQLLLEQITFFCLINFLATGTK